MPKKRQTMLFSATHSPKVDDLVKIALRTNPLNIGVAEKKEDNDDDVTAQGLEQVFIFVLFVNNCKKIIT